MRGICLVLCFLIFEILHAQDVERMATTKTFQLAPPIINTPSVFFEEATTVELDFDFPNVVLRYTLNGEPVSDQSPVYRGPISLTETEVVTAKGFHPDYLDSDAVQMKTLKIDNNLTLRNIDITPSPNPKFYGLGTSGLMDGRKGSRSFSSDPQWLGFQSDSISLKTTFTKPSSISKVILSVLTNQSSWIFLPEKVAVYFDGKLMGSVTYSNAGEQTSSQFEFLEILVKSGIYENLEVVVYPLQAIPPWHQGKGTKPWFFIDELLMQ